MAKIQTNSVKVDNKAVFALANKIRGAKKCDMKTAYAEAKAQLIAEAMAAEKKQAEKKQKAAGTYTKSKAEKKQKAAKNTTDKVPGKRGRKPVIATMPVQTGLSMQEVISILSKRNANITFINNRGKEETTRGTLVAGNFPSREKVAGRKELKAGVENAFTYYDVRHGVYRTLKMEKFVSLQ